MGDAPPFATWNTDVCVESADETARRVREAGGQVFVEPFDVIESGRMAVFADPEGTVVSAREPKEHQGSRVVNEHGSVNFNVLNTRDLEGAKAFYGAVFGWGTMDFGGSDGRWTLPGYGDHLEELTPGLRERNAEFGAPPGFEDVVATLNRSVTTSRTRRRTGASRSRSTPRTTPRSGRRSSAQRSSCPRRMRRGCGSA